MARREQRRNTGLSSFIIYFVATAFVLFVIIQGYNAVFKNVPTETAVKGTATESFSTKGVIFRDETLLYSDGQGILDYTVKNGEKLANGSVVAAYYESQEDIDNKKKISALEAELGSYTDVLTSAQAGSGDVKANDLTIEKNMQILLSHNLKGDYKSSSELKNDIRMLINRRRYISGEVANFDSEIAAIVDKITELGSAQGAAVSEVKAPRGGYFSRSVDGYEERINTYTMSFYDVPALRDLMNVSPSEVSDNVIGKIVASFEFYYLVTLDKSTADTIYVGQNVSIRFKGMEDMLYPATVYEISEQYDNQYVVKFKSTYTAYGMNLERMQEADIIVGEYSGIKVPKTAVRMSDGKEGVYVLVGSIAKFRTIETQYLQGDYYIVKQDNTSSTALLLGDQIIVQGTDIYDGKVMK